MSAARCILAALVVSAFAGSVLAAPIRVENDRLALEFDSATGAWTALIDKASGRNLVADAAGAGAAGLAVSGAGGTAAVVSHSAAVGRLGLDLAVRSGPWLVHAAYTLRTRSSVVARQFTVENASDETQVLRNCVCVLPTISPGEGAAAIFPGALPVGDLPLGQAKPGDLPAPSSMDGLAYIWSAKAECGVGAWCDSQEEYSPVRVAAAGGAGRIRHNVGVLARLKPGEKVALGTHYVWLSRVTRDNLLRSVDEVFRMVDLMPPPGGLERMGERILYCGHPGGTPEQGFRAATGFKGLEAYLPTLQRMGVDVLWLLPIFDHGGDPNKWNLYSPFDHFKISPLYGTPEDLKRLSAAARQAGIDLVLDFVPHGPPDHTPLAKAHPEWVCLKEDGSQTYVWGQLAFDNALPQWQDYMRRAAEYNAREYGAVGARIDVAAGSPPNWNPAAGNRPSHSTLAGGLGMCRAIREGFQLAMPRVLIVPEEYTGANVFYRVGDLTYDCQLFFLFVELQKTAASPEVWADRLQQFLNDQSQTLPPYAVKMRWTANHDTVSWTFLKKRTRDAYGPERARAMLALCCLIDGVPMIYQGEEDPAVYGGKGESDVDYIAKIVACRKRLPVLLRGTAQYGTVRASGGVFVCARGLGTEAALVLVSLCPEAITSSLELPARHTSTDKWKDELTGEIVELAGVPLAGYQVRVLTRAR